MTQMTEYNDSFIWNKKSGTIACWILRRCYLKTVRKRFKLSGKRNKCVETQPKRLDILKSSTTHLSNTVTRYSALKSLKASCSIIIFDDYKHRYSCQWQYYRFSEEKMSSNNSPYDIVYVYLFRERNTIYRPVEI